MFRVLSFVLLISIIDWSSKENQDNPSNIVFFGDSITAGYGIPIEQAFTSLIQEKIREREKPKLSRD